MFNVFLQTVHFSALKTSSLTCPIKRSMPSPTRGKDSMRDCGRLKTTQKWSSPHQRYLGSTIEPVQHPYCDAGCLHIVYSVTIQLTHPEIK